MANVKRFSRDLAPHAAWRGIEWLWDLARAIVMAALIAMWQWFIHHWDIITILIVFAGSLGLLIWRDVSRRYKTPKRDSEGPSNLDFLNTAPGSLNEHHVSHVQDDARSEENTSELQ